MVTGAVTGAVTGEQGEEEAVTPTKDRMFQRYGSLPASPSSSGSIGGGGGGSTTGSLSGGGGSGSLSGGGHSVGETPPPHSARVGTTSLSVVLLLVVAGDLVYSGTILVGAVSQFFVSFLAPEGCIVWGSFIILGYTIVFFALPTFFLLFFIQCTYPHLAIFHAVSPASGAPQAPHSRPLLRSQPSSSSLSTTSSTSSTSSSGSKPVGSLRRSRTFARLVLAGVVLTVVALSAGFQAMWALTYRAAFDLMSECGQELCAEKIHIHRAATTAMSFVYLLPFLFCLAVCPVFAFLSLRAIKRQVMLTGTYTEVERRQQRDLRRLILLYLAGFFLCYLPNILEFVLSFFLPAFCEPNNISDMYWLNILQVGLNPLHGVWNSVIFVWRSHIPTIIISKGNSFLLIFVILIMYHNHHILIMIMILQSSPRWRWTTRSPTPASQPVPAQMI